MRAASPKLKVLVKRLRRKDACSLKVFLPLSQLYIREVILVTAADHSKLVSGNRIKANLLATLGIIQHADSGEFHREAIYC